MSKKPIRISEFCKKHGFRPQQINGWIRKNNMPHTVDTAGKRVLHEDAALKWIEDWRGGSRKRQKRDGPRRTAADDNWDLPPVGTWLWRDDRHEKIIGYHHAVGDTNGTEEPIEVALRPVTSFQATLCTVAKFRNDITTRRAQLRTPDEVRKYLRKLLTRPAVFATLEALDGTEEALAAASFLIKFLEPKGDIRVGSQVQLAREEELDATPVT